MAATRGDLPPAFKPASLIAYLPSLLRRSSYHRAALPGRLLGFPFTEAHSLAYKFHVTKPNRTQRRYRRTDSRLIAP
jgi:hypothetical protein